MRHLIRSIAFFILTLWSHSGFAEPQNLAFNKPYRLEPPPNYTGCTESGDATQLTDGKYVTGYFWTQPGTVGWSGHSPVTVTIDLQTNQPIAGLSLNTAAAGVAGVSWPSAIFIWVSDDEKTGIPQGI